MLARSSRGTDVKDVQRKLEALGYDLGVIDGIFGTKTEGAVLKFQSAYGLPITGRVDNTTQAKINALNSTHLRIGTKSANVGVIQEKLNALGFFCGAIDNNFGTRTRGSVIAFQTVNKLVPDGIVGPITLRELERDYNVKHLKHVIAPGSIHVDKIDYARRIKHVELPGNHFNQVPKRNSTKYIFEHHIAGNESPQEVNTGHLEKGWAGAGYHIEVDFDGTAYWLRPIDLVPSATLGMNHCSIAVVVNGNCSKKAPTQAQLDTLEWLIPYLKSLYPGVKYLGHNEAVKLNPAATVTACPGDLFPLAELKSKFNK